MTFRPFSGPRLVRWKPKEGVGLEHVDLQSEGDEWVVRGVVIGALAGTAYGVDYTIVCDAGFVTRELHLGTTAGHALSLVSDGQGQWRNHDGRILPEFAGCLDVDLMGSAFTNTLPIRRIDWDTVPDGRAEVATLYIPFDSFAPVMDRQIYTRLNERRFRFEAADGGFEAEIGVDEDGLVLDYPGLFTRAQ